jgi:uncharacterized protein YjbI with pentapeptide repeats
MQGVERLTIFVKATFTLRPGGSAELSAPLELVREDRPRDGWGSLEEAAETAPYLPSAGVIARGHACAPEGHAVTSLKVRLALFQQRWILNKVLHVFGDRTRSAPSPQAFQRMPLIYERAYGAPHVDTNPAGQGAGEALPNILDPADPARPAGFGPIAKQWAPRKHFAAWSPRVGGGVEEINPALDFRYFHAAPADQQIDFLRGNEWVFLEGFHPRFPSISSSLPSARGAARLYRARSTGASEESVELVADTLVIDADRLICSIVWRGNVALGPFDKLAGMRVLAGVELHGAPIPWPATEAGYPAAVNLAAPKDPGETLRLPLSATEAILKKPIAPFALAEPAPKSSPSASAIPGAPWSAEHAAPPALSLEPAPGEETLRLSSASSKDLRASLDALTGTAPTGAPHGLPFTPVTPPPPRPEPASTPIPSGLPFTPAEPSAPRAETPSALITTGLPFTPSEYSPPRPELVAPLAPLAGEAPPRFPEPPSLVQGSAPLFEIADELTAPLEADGESAGLVAAPLPREEPEPPAFVAVPPPALVASPPALVEPPAAEPPARRPLFVLGKAPEPAEPAPPANEASSAPPPPAANAPSSNPPPPPASAASSNPPPPPASIRHSIPPPPSIPRPPLAPAEPSIPAMEATDAPPLLAVPIAPVAPVTSSEPASAPPGEADEKDLRARVIARLKRGEGIYDLELAGAELEGVDFSGALLERRSLSGSNLARCNFTGAKLTGADMRGVNLTDALLTDAEMTGVNLSRATLDRARLNGATLNNADLSLARGSGARFEGAALRGVNLRQARLPEGVFNSADLSGVNAGKADMSLSSFMKANLRGASLRDAKLKQAALAGANVDRADLRDADLTGVNVHGVNFAGAKTNGAILRDLIEEPPPDWPDGSA